MKNKTKSSYPHHTSLLPGLNCTYLPPCSSPAVQGDEEWKLTKVLSSPLVVLLPSQGKSSPSPGWGPLSTRPQILLPRDCFTMGFPQALNLLQAFPCSSVGSSMGCRWISVPPWTSMGGRGISALAPRAPPTLPSSPTWVSAGLFPSHIFTLAAVEQQFSPAFKICDPGGIATITVGLSLGQHGSVELVHIGSVRHRKFLAAFHRSHWLPKPLGMQTQSKSRRSDMDTGYCRGEWELWEYPTGHHSSWADRTVLKCCRELQTPVNFISLHPPVFWDWAELRAIILTQLRSPNVLPESR